MNKLVAPGTPIDNLHTIQRRVDTTLDVERTALTLLAFAIAVAGLMLVAQALRRSVSVLDDDVPALRAMGYDRSSFAMAPTCSHLVVAGIGAALTLVTALIASRWFPIGLAAEIDPDRGIHADWTVLGVGLALVTIGVLGFAAVIGWRLAGTRGRGESTGPQALPRVSARSPRSPSGWVRRWRSPEVAIGRPGRCDPR